MVDLSEFRRQHCGVSFSGPHEEAQDPWVEERLRLLNEVGVHEKDAFLSEDTAPPIDRDRLIALAKQELRESEARDVCELIANYRSWRDGFGSVLSELSGNSEQGKNES